MEECLTKPMYFLNAMSKQSNYIWRGYTFLHENPPPCETENVCNQLALSTSMFQKALCNEDNQTSIGLH